eukprot:2558594-Heterocapsa_arctica.AAC.1
MKVIKLAPKNGIITTRKREYPAAPKYGDWPGWLHAPNAEPNPKKGNTAAPATWPANPQQQQQQFEQSQID